MSWRVVGVCLILLGCGGAQRPAARRCPVERPEATGSANATGEPSAGATVTAASEPDGLVDEGCVSDRRTLEASDGELTRLEARIEEGRAALSTAGADCARICAAAANLCEAAGEVCRLARDDSPRCARARSSCAEATLRREGACPACPAR